MGKDSGGAPQAPDPTKLIPLQSAADKAAFNYQTNAARYNTVGPDQSVNWAKQSQFDQPAYDTALKAWQAANAQGTWVPGTPAGGYQTGSGDSGDWVSTPGTPGYWSGATTNNASAPSREDFQRDTWTQTTQLTPEQQRLHDLNQSSDIGRAGLLGTLTQRLGSTYANPVDYSGVSPINESITPGGPIQGSANIGGYEAALAGLDPAQYNAQAADAVYNAQRGYFNEDQATSQRALEARLAEQGFVPGTPGYTQAMNAYQDNQNQALNQLRNQSTTQGFAVGNQQFGNRQSSLNSAIAAALSGGQFANQAQAQGFGQNQQQAQFGNTSRAQQIAELLQAREQPLNELNAVRSGTQTNTSGQNAPAGNTGIGNLGSTDVLGAYNNQYKNLLNQYNAGVASDNADTQALVGLASIAAMVF